MSPICPTVVAQLSVVTAMSPLVPVHRFGDVAHGASLLVGDLIRTYIRSSNNKAGVMLNCWDVCLKGRRF